MKITKKDLRILHNSLLELKKTVVRGSRAYKEINETHNKIKEIEKNIKELEDESRKLEELLKLLQ